MRRWGPKVIHYGSKTIENKSSIGADAIITELFILICLTFFAVVGYFSKFLVLLVMCGLGAVAVLVTLVRELYDMYSYRKAARSEKSAEKEQG